MKPVAMHSAAMAASALLALSAAAGAAEVTTSPSAANRNELAPSAPGVTPTPGQGALEFATHSPLAGLRIAVIGFGRSGRVHETLASRGGGRASTECDARERRHQQSRKEDRGA